VTVECDSSFPNLSLVISHVSVHFMNPENRVNIFIFPLVTYPSYLFVTLSYRCANSELSRSLSLSVTSRLICQLVEIWIAR
jgi:hypothetical protein